LGDPQAWYKQVADLGLRAVRYALPKEMKIHVPPHLLASIFQVKLARMILTPSRSEKPSDHYARITAVSAVLTRRGKPFEARPSKVKWMECRFRTGD